MLAEDADGTDTVDCSAAGAGVKVDLVAGTAEDGDGGIDRLISIEAVIGTGFDDMFKVGDTTVRIEAGEGIDTIDLSGRSEGATIDLGTGGGDIEVMGGENLIGSEQADMLTGDGQENRIEGGGGNDTLDGGDDDVRDELTGGEGADTFLLRGNDVVLDIEAGDRLRAASGAAIGGTVKANDDGAFMSGGMEFSGPSGNGARGTLTIKFSDGTSATVENWRNGDAGLRLKDRDEEEEQEGAEMLASPLVLDLDGGEEGIDVVECSFLNEKYLLSYPKPCASLAI